MLRSGAAVVGFGALWLLTTLPVRSLAEVGVALAAALAAAALGLRMGGPPSAALAGVLARSFARSGVIFTGSLPLLRKALGPVSGVRPGLVRIRARGTSGERAAFATLLAATPGLAVVEIDEDGLLIHVLNEDTMRPQELARLDPVADTVGER